MSQILSLTPWSHSGLHQLFPTCCCFCIPCLVERAQSPARLHLLSGALSTSKGAENLSKQHQAQTMAFLPTRPCAASPSCSC